MNGTALRRGAARVLAIALLAGALAQPALGQAITFSPLSGATGDPYAGHIESGFKVTALTPNWYEDHAFGNPVPSIFGGPVSLPLTVPPVAGVIEVRRIGAGLFTFQSVDLSSNGAPGTAYDITGLLLASNIFTQAGFIGSADTFETIAAAFPALSIDQLLITLVPAPGVPGVLPGATSFNVDNISVTAVRAGVVPEPATVALFATGALVIAGVARRRSRR